LDRGTPVADPTPDRSAGPRRLWWLGAASIAAALTLAHHLHGAPGLVVGTAVLIVLGTCARLGWEGVAGRRASRARVEVAHACSVLASQLRVGRVQADALRSAAEDCPVLADGCRAQDLGGDVTLAWRNRSLRPGHAGLADLARAWEVSARTGAPLAHSLEQVADTLAADVALRAVVAGELAAPRATGKIMAVLPFCGLGMGYLLGGRPLQFMLSSRYGWVCALGGVLLAAAGVLWIDRLARRAAEQD
jgi:tight adherence protein B